MQFISRDFGKNQFDEKCTWEQQFFVSESEEVEVQLMHVTETFRHVKDCREEEFRLEGMMAVKEHAVGHRTKKFKHAEDSGELACQILELPYQGEDLSMVILLPHDTHGLGKLEEDLTHDKLQKALALVSQSHPHKVEVSLPRFKLTQQFKRNEILANMGATDMFNEFEADFSSMSPGPEKLHLNEAL
ncbi:hypothetical protein ACROYT_G027769 [Oculina patagonica]